MSTCSLDLNDEDEASTERQIPDITQIIGIAGDGDGPTDMARDKHRLIGEAVSALHDERLQTRHDAQ